MARQCEDCGSTMPAFVPRKRTEDGKLKCDACASGRPGGGRATAELLRVAHDSGDGATINHCPFCGGGEVIAVGSDVKCNYCGSTFTVQVQPEFPGMPQTGPDGQPLGMPNMPGNPGEAAGAPGAAGADAGMGAPGDGSMPPGGGADDTTLVPDKANDEASDKAKADDDQGEDPDKALVPHGSDEKSDKARSDDEDAKKPDGGDGGGGGDADSKSKDDKGGDDKDSDKPPWLKGKKSTRYFLVDGGVLDEDRFMVHVALRCADDKEAVLAQVRAERQKEGV